MPLKIVRNDIIKMKTEAIVNTANEYVQVGDGCDNAIYQAAGYDELLAYRQKHIGRVKEGESFITPAFKLQAKYIIHTVSPFYDGEGDKAEKLLRKCYINSLKLAKKNKIQSIAFPLISTGSFGYPKEEGLRIAVDEINSFLLKNDMLVYLVVFDSESTEYGKRIYPELKSYIDSKYVEKTIEDSFAFGAPYMREAKSGNFAVPKAPRQKGFAASGGAGLPFASASRKAASIMADEEAYDQVEFEASEESLDRCMLPDEASEKNMSRPEPMLMNRCMSSVVKEPEASCVSVDSQADATYEDYNFDEHDSKIKERMKHLTDTYSEYLLYLIESKNMENADVYKRAIVDKKVFSKIKNNPNYHPQKFTALCLCVGARLNLDETRDLLARAGYALSPCDKTDIIFSYFIENKIYDMIELDIMLEEYGLPCIIT